MEKIPDFSHRRNFPGTLHNEFDVILRRVEDLEKIPLLFFAGLLFLVAVLPTYGNWWWTFGLWLFFLGDWAILAALPRVGKSFGPPKPPTLILAIMRAVFALLPLAAAIPLQGIGTLLVIYAFWIEPHRIRVTHQKLMSPKLKAGQPLRVLHLADLHIEHITKREQELLNLIQQLQPDLILFSGDILNLSYVEDRTSWEEARKIMGQWQAPGGVYVVTGSPAVDLEHVFPQLVEGLPLCWLKDERTTVYINGHTVDLVGLTCTHKPFEDAPRLKEVLSRNEAEAHFTILLYHTPDLAPNVAETRQVDLQLSGHTHGGQVRVPGFGALFAGSLYGKRFEAGRTQLDNLTLYVSRGIGLEGKAAPRVRFFCPPEIILWEINGEK